MERQHRFPGLIIWGVPVEADRGLVVVEALHRFPADDLATMAETLVKLFVEVRRALSQKAWARDRHVQRYLAAQRPSEEEVARYQEIEAQKEMRRFEIRAQREEGAIMEMSRLLRRIEGTRVSGRSRLAHLGKMRLRRRAHHRSGLI